MHSSLSLGPPSLALFTNPLNKLLQRQPPELHRNANAAVDRTECKHFHDVGTAGQGQRTHFTQTHIR